MILKTMLTAAGLYLLLAPVRVEAQTSPAGYDAKWAIVDSLANKAGLPQSALKEINGIYALARQEHNDGQQIRALVYRIVEENATRENDDTTAIKELEAAYRSAPQPARSILQSLTAGAYLHYFQLNRWKLYNRTATVNFVKTDIATWTTDDFQHTISTLYLESLQAEVLLKHIPLEQYEPILIKGNARYLRPTLFDLLAHEALNYFVSSETDIRQPANVFEIDDKAVFAYAPVFAAHSFFSGDTASLHYKALRLFQQLISFHLSDARPDALIDVDISRLDFARNYAVMEDKDGEYRQALTYITTRYGDRPAAAQAWYLQAAEDHTAAVQSKDWGETGDVPALRGNIRAKAICEKVLAEKDSSEGKTNCQFLLATILQKKLSLQIENVNLPGKPMRSLVSWSNFSRLYLRLIRTDSLHQHRPRYSDEDGYWDNLLSLPAYRSFEQELPATGDYLEHSTEIAIGSLPPGVYTLIGCTDSGWSRANGVVTEAVLYVSSIAYIDQGRDYFVVNRETGQPLSGATVQIWGRTFAPRSGTEKLEKRELYHTDAQGHVQLRKRGAQEDREQQLLDISFGGDRLFMTDAAIFSPFEVKPNLKPTVYFFLDRSIYRPGQTVYFKGITITRDSGDRQHTVWAGRKTKVALYNTNGEKVDELSLTTDEFGAYHGTFRLPEHQLNGVWRVTDAGTGGGTSFSVEEYKRPTFYVDFEKPKGSYRVGDSIRITGNAKAFAGNNLDGVKVKYRVVREARLPHFWLSWRRVAPFTGSSQEIAHGELTTDANGAFRLTFAALPDRHVEISSDPRFDYRVEADVTDINGETRSGSTRITAGYTVLDLSIALPDNSRMTPDSLRRFTVEANNLSGEPVSSTVHVAAYPLQSPTRLIRERLWAAPDIFVIPESAFLDSFPHDEYRDELTREKWVRGAMVWEATDSTSGDGRSADERGGQDAGTQADERAGGRSGGGRDRDGQATFHIPGGRLSAGWWVIEATATDAGGRTVKDLQYVELYDGGTGRPATPEYNWAGPATTVTEPGGKARVEAGSSAADVYVIRQIERPGQHFGSFDYFTLNNSKNATEWTITEADRGGFGIADAFVKDNRLYSHQAIVQVPWTNKELQIRYTTFRDKTEPGSEEKWGVTISGYKSEQVSASVLTAMYDASLDRFKAHSWRPPHLFPQVTRSEVWGASQNFRTVFSNGPIRGWVQPVVYRKVYDRMMSVGNIGTGAFPFRSNKMMTLDEVELKAMPGVHMSADGKVTAQGESLERIMVNGKGFVSDAGVPGIHKDAITYNSRGTEPRMDAGEAAPPEVSVRKNFNETAFFLPDLRTDSAGDVRWSFTMPEALTQWKWMTLAYTRDLAFGYSERTIVTQKKLMVQPNVARYLREGDRMNMSVKVVNLTDTEMTGQAALALTDPTTGETADGWFVNRQPNQYFTVAAHSSAVVDFPLDIPFQYNRPLTYRITAQSGNYSDGEEATLPVVSNRILVTETLPLNMSGDGTKAFHFDKLLHSGSSETLNHHALTVEFTTNPTWYAIQSLPYLMEYPYECAEQTFERFYANALASKIVNSSPRIAQVFSAWRTTDTAALLSNLEKNPELKSVLLEETPWVLQGKTETQQKKNVALLFDLNRMSAELGAAIDRLTEMQATDGGFPWFKGGVEDQYVTQYILTGIGHLQRLKAIPADLKEKINTMVMAAIGYVDRQILAEYQQDLKADGERGAGAGGGAAGGTVRVAGYLAVQYLYMRSIFDDYGIPGDIFPAVNYYRKQVQKGWLQENRFMQGMIALALFRTGDVQTARNIIASLRQNAMHDEEKGMWWKDMEGGYYWYQAPIETQSLLIEAFREISGDAATDRELKTWLLRQKQTHSWKTTVATADACYALLMGADNWLGAERAMVIKLGDKTINWTGGGGAMAGAETADMEASGAASGAGRAVRGSGPMAGPGEAEAGTGYYKKVFDAPFINPSMGNITVTMQTKGGGGPPAWGAVYWQYFDQLDQITAAGGAKAPLRLAKRLFVQRNTDHGPVLDTIPDNGSLKVGDRVVVRIELRADRDLEYVHMKDMRAACLEPVDVLSAYKWQGGLGYYETTKDASTEFFFPEVRRGTYVFEYTLTAGQTGNFSNGIASVECMYAPEFAYHSEGIRINVEGTP